MSSVVKMATGFDASVLGEIGPRKAIGVTGADRASFLQGLLTNDIQVLTPGTGCYAAWLTPQGRMLTDLHVFESGDMILLDVPAALQPAILARLEQFIFSEDVQVLDLGDALRSVWTHGRAAAATIERVAATLFGLAEWRQYQNARADIAGGSVVVARIDQLGVPGFCIHADAAHAAAVSSALEAAGAGAGREDAIQVARIVAGYPLFGVDMTDDTIPLEAGIESRAISQTKGCYVGQEIIIRVLHRGQGRVARRLVQLTVEDEMPLSGSRVFAGTRDVGYITSAARSSDHGPVALAYLHRDFVAKGTRLEIDADGRRLVAVVAMVSG